MLEGLRARGLIVACASWNDPEPVDEIFSLLDLGRYFDYKKVERHPHKERTISALLRELAGSGTAPAADEVLYVDDRPIHVDAIRAAVGPVRFLQYGADIHALEEVLGYLDRAQREPSLRPHRGT